MDNESKENLINIIKDDLVVLSLIGCGNFRLEFIYEKHDNQKLKRIMQHEENGVDNS